MLNISKDPIKNFDFQNYQSGKTIFDRSYFQGFNRFLWISSLVFSLMLFLPWTQNLVGKGYVTTLTPDKRPQTLQSPIPGKIERWFIREGDRVQKGDTLLKIAEIKSDYFDPQLLVRTQIQLQAKQEAVKAYKMKVNALENQLIALNKERSLKLEQAKNKQQQAQLYIQNDSLKLEVAKTDQKIAEVRLQREEDLYADGLKSLRELESKRLKLREAQTDYLSAENSFRNAKNEATIARVEIDRIKANFADKTAKIRSDMASAQSSQFEAEGQVAKLQNTLANYQSRIALQYITAPQSGFINKTLKAGIGETFKAGEKLLSIMPSNYQMAVETYIRPIDIPLIKVGEKARIEFDGWPAIVFSGWPSVSYGTYGAKVIAIENYISDNDLYRVLLVPDLEDHPWPEEVRIGSGARTIALLNEVPVWYELWRQLNGFPPDYYKVERADQLKLPIKIK